MRLGTIPRRSDERVCEIVIDRRAASEASLVAKRVGTPPILDREVDFSCGRRVSVIKDDVDPVGRAVLLVDDAALDLHLLTFQKAAYQRVSDEFKEFFCLCLRKTAGMGDL